MPLVSDAEAILGRAISPGALDLLTGDLNERLRVREMEETYFTVPEASLPLPSFFLHAISVDVDGTKLTPTPPHMLRPGTFAISGDKLRLGTLGDLLTLEYVARIPPFEEERASRAYSAYPALFLYGLLAHHATLVRDDDGINRWSPRFEGALAEANKNDTRARQSQISMRPVPRYRP